MSLRSFILAAALLMAASASRAELISADPDSMFYGASWQALDELSYGLESLAFYSDGAIFPECAPWLFQFQPLSSPTPVIDNNWLPPAIDAPPTIDVDWIEPPPCIVDCGGPTPPLTAVPEPSTYLMLLMGFIGICALGRRRRA